MIHIILLSGGSGTRLWPLSNNARSKQFLKVLRDGDGNRVSMVQRTFSLIAQASLEADVTVAACSSQQAGIEAQIEGSFSLVLEPERRDTAPAIMLACAHLAFVQGADPADTVVVLPIDPYTEQAYYDKIVDLDAAVHARIADLVLMGVEPAYPSEKYGYIVPASRNGGAWRVARFKEKPREAEAKELLAEGALWNCGVFAFRLESFSALCATMWMRIVLKTCSTGIANFRKTASTTRWSRRRLLSPSSPTRASGKTWEHGTRFARRWPTSIPAALQ